MTYIQADKTLRLLCVNGESFISHPSKLRSFNYKVLLNNHFLKIIEFTNKARQYEELVQFITQHVSTSLSTPEEIILYLLDLGLLQNVNESTEFFNDWENNHWRESLQFHLHTNNLPKMMYNTKEGESEDINAMETYVKESSPPSNYKILAGKKVILTKPTIEKDLQLSSLFQEVKSVSLDKLLLSRLLYYAFGQIGVRHMRVTGGHVRKTDPSGGSRHPIEVYPIIKNVSGIDSGIYHYNVKEHVLTLCMPLTDLVADQIIRENILLDNNRPGFDFSLAFLYSCVFARSMFRYRESRSYRVMHYDMGHLTQNLAFLAKCYGLNLYSGYSCHEESLEKLIGLDSYMESILSYSVL